MRSLASDSSRHQIFALDKRALCPTKTLQTLGLSACRISSRAARWRTAADNATSPTTISA